MRAAALVLGALLAGGLLLGPGAMPASAEEGIGPTPGPTASATPPPPAAAGPGLISTPASGEFVPERSVSVTGTKNAGSTVNVTVPGAAGCASRAADTALATWSCTTALPDGQGVGITATETLPDATTRVSTVTVDVLGPPTINADSPQTAPGRASGTGRTGSTIHLSVDENEQVCHAPVTDGRWLCTIANGPGTYQVTARQNAGYGISAASTPVTIQVNAAPPADPPAPVTPVPAQPAPVVPPQNLPSDPPPSPAPSPPAHDRADAGTIPWLDRPIFPGPGGDGPTVREALTNWGTPTEFGTQLPSPRDTVTGGNWLWDAALALTFIGLIALPLRMLATALRGRHPLRAPQLTGRNRGSIPAEEDAPRNPWILGAVPLAATAGLIVLAEGLNGEVRYLRLLVAVAVGLAILNLVGVAVVSRLASERVQVSSRLRFVPVLLVAAAVATILARLTGIEPPLVGGVLIGTGFALAVPVRPRALVNLAQVGAVLGLAVLAWFTHDAIGVVDGFWASAAREAVATVCLAGVGSALILMLPLGALPGRVVLEWSPKAWFASTLAVGTVSLAVILGHSQSAFPMLASGLIVAGFAAVCVATWAWLNYVQVSRA